MVFYEDTKRSFIKTITYRIVIIISTLIIVYIFTGNVTITLGVTFITSLANTILYYLHERLWNNIYWGKKK